MWPLALLAVVAWRLLERLRRAPASYLRVGYLETAVVAQVAEEEAVAAEAAEATVEAATELSAEEILLGISHSRDLEEDEATPTVQAVELEVRPIVEVFTQPTSAPAALSPDEEYEEQDLEHHIL